MAEEEEYNRKYQKRLFYLLPFNCFLLFGTLKYSKNIQPITKYFFPNMRKVSIKNLFIVGTCQAIVFSSIFLVGNMTLLGINPKEVYARHLKQKQEELDLMTSTPVDPNAPMLEQFGVFMPEDEGEGKKALPAGIKDVFLI